MSELENSTEELWISKCSVSISFLCSPLALTSDQIRTESMENCRYRHDDEDEKLRDYMAVSCSTAV